jgi:hypothetical protein
MHSYERILLLAAVLGAAPVSTSAEDKGASLIGLNTCDRPSKEYAGTFEPFAKDPDAFSLRDVTSQGVSLVVVVEHEAGKNCGPIIAQLNLGRTQSETKGVGLNCAVLHQPFDRSTSYLGWYEFGTEEYSPVESAWIFNFDTLTFAPFDRPQDVYCANFIAD